MSNEFSVNLPVEFLLFTLTTFAVHDLRHYLFTELSCPFFKLWETPFTRFEIQQRTEN
jgi:hypothetical protein